MGFFLFLVMVVLVITFISKGIVIIKQAETMVVERLGRYDRTLESGLCILWPVVDQPRPVHWRYTRTDFSGASVIVTQRSNRIDLRETVYDFPGQNVITKDNVGIIINALLYFQVIDPIKAVYEIANLPEAIEKLTQTTLRNVIGELDFDETLVSRDTINTKLREILDDAAEKWGVKVNRVELQDITPPKDIQQAMEKQMRAERDRRASILTAEGAKTSAILQAEGEKTAAILKAEGQAQARIKVAEAESQAIKVITEVLTQKGDPAAYLIAIKYIEALKEMVSGKDNKVVYLPYEASGVMSSLGGIKELFSNMPKQ